MSAAQALKDLLAPLAVYRWEGSFQWAELLSVGAALDACQENLDQIQREMNLMSAEGEGLQNICSLLSSVPISPTPKQLREALAALLRIGDGSFTSPAVSDNVSGCGISAQVKETDTPGKVEISFPGTPGIPDDFLKLRPVIEEIVPCHLEIAYVFWYILWSRVEERLSSWRILEGYAFSWKDLERFVRD